MTNTTNNLGIQRRIPLPILCEALIEELSGGLDSQHLKELLKSETDAYRTVEMLYEHIKTIVTNPVYTPILKEYNQEILSALKTQSDRNIILLAFICARFPFAYNLLSLLGKQFRLQDEITTQLIMRIIGSKVGMNKSAQNTLYAILPTFVESGLIQRPKIGTYTQNPPLAITSPITWTIWKESFYANNPLSKKGDDNSICYEPYFSFVIHSPK